MLTNPNASGSKGRNRLVKAVVIGAIGAVGVWGAAEIVDSTVNSKMVNDVQFATTGVVTGGNKGDKACVVSTDTIVFNDGSSMVPEGAQVYSLRASKNGPSDIFNDLGVSLDNDATRLCVAGGTFLGAYPLPMPVTTKNDVPSSPMPSSS